MAPIKELPSQEELIALFDYDPKVGELLWRIAGHGKRIGMKAGTVTNFGYRVVRIRGTSYRVARVIWKWMIGEDPPEQIDHKDLERLNDRWDNLRLATSAQNLHNVGKYITNTSGVKDVCWHKGKWQVTMKVNGENVYVGRFESKEKAREAWMHVAEKLHGEFVRG